MLEPCRSLAREAERTLNPLSTTQARSSGLLALEDAQIPDPFFKKAVNLLVDGHDPAVVRSILSKDMNLTLVGHKEGRNPRVIQDMLTSYVPGSKRASEEQAA